jgi:hypothetical protein
MVQRAEEHDGGSSDEGSRESERCLLIAAVVALLLGLVWLLGRAA